jgi:hypothetical protein
LWTVLELIGRNPGMLLPLVVVAGYLTGIRYRDEIVQPYDIPFIQAQANNVTFQQDNARPHGGILFQMRINAGLISADVTG